MRNSYVLYSIDKEIIDYYQYIKKVIKGLVSNLRIEKSILPSTIKRDKINILFPESNDCKLENEAIKKDYVIHKMKSQKTVQTKYKCGTCNINICIECYDTHRHLRYNNV